MSDHASTEQYFEYIRELPDGAFSKRAASLVGFEQRYERAAGTFKLILDPDGVRAWSRKQHGRVLPLCEVLEDRHPLVIFEGDVGTGKTATAEGIASRLAADLRREGYLLKLSTRVRGSGIHAGMTRAIHAGFERLSAEAGKRRIAILLIDEADAIAASRGTDQMHQEEKSGVNTLIQRLDDLRGLGGRAMVILTTNRVGAVDEALVRRAALRVRFDRPTDEERAEVLRGDLDGVGLSDSQIRELVALTGPGHNDGLGFTFSDLRLRFIPDAVLTVFPDKPLTFDELVRAAERIIPSPEIK